MPALVIRFVITEDKTGLHPFRLLSILSLPWLVARTVPRHAAWLESRPASPFVLMGQNSLPVFCFGIFFGFYCPPGAGIRRRGGRCRSAVNLCGAVTMVSVGASAAWYRAKGRAAARPAGRRLPVRGTH